MKKLIGFILFSLTIFSGVFAQTTFTATVEAGNDGFMLSGSSVGRATAGYVESQAFGLSRYDGFSFATYPFTVTYDANTAGDTTYLYVYGSNDNSNYFIVDTLASVVSSTAASTTANFNNKKYKYWKVRATFEAADTLSFQIHQPRKEGY